jgi:hypothetical protein
MATWGATQPFQVPQAAAQQGAGNAGQQAQQWQLLVRLGNNPTLAKVREVRGPQYTAALMQIKCVRAPTSRAAATLSPRAVARSAACAAPLAPR